MSVYSFQKELYEMANALEEENAERKTMLLRANDIADSYLYRKEAKVTNADSGLFKAPKKLPPRYDLRKHDTDEAPAKSKSSPSDTIPRKAHVANLPKSIKALIKQHKKPEAKVSGVILEKKKDGSITVSTKGFQDHTHGLTEIMDKKIRVTTGHKDYDDMYTLFAASDLMKTKVSQVQQNMEKAARDFNIPMPVWVDPESAIQLMAWKKAIIETANKGDLLKDGNTVNYSSLKQAFIGKLDSVRVAKDITGQSVSIKDLNAVKENKKTASLEKQAMNKVASYWETCGARATDFHKGDYVMRYDGVLPGQVVAVHPGINFVDVQYPTGWEQEEPEELILLTLFGALPPAPKTSRFKRTGNKGRRRLNNVKRIVYNINRFNPVYPYAVSKQARLETLVGAELIAPEKLKTKIASVLNKEYEPSEVEDARKTVLAAINIAEDFA